MFNGWSGNVKRTGRAIADAAQTRWHLRAGADTCAGVPVGLGMRS
jgi:hypothetical protein